MILKHSIRFLSIFITSFAFSGDFYTESTIPDDAGADYVIIQDNRVVDIIDKSLGYNVNIPIPNTPPIVNAGSNVTIYLGESFTLSGYASDTDGAVVSYIWETDNSILSRNSSFLYSPTALGTYTLTFSAFDDQGISSSDSLIVNVIDRRGFVGKYTAAYSGTSNNISIPLTNLSQGFTSKPKKGDLVVLSFAWYDNTSFPSLPSSWNILVRTTKRMNDVYRVGQIVAYKIMGDVPDTSITVYGGTTYYTRAGGAIVQVFRGINPSNPISSSALFESSGYAKPNPPALSYPGANHIVVSGGSAGHIRGNVAFSVNSNDYDKYFTFGSNDNGDISIGAGYKILDETVQNPNPSQYNFLASDSSRFPHIGWIFSLNPL